jgi:chromosome segregation ATPase
MAQVMSDTQLLLATKQRLSQEQLTASLQVKRVQDQREIVESQLKERREQWASVKSRLDEVTMNVSTVKQNVQVARKQVLDLGVDPVTKGRRKVFGIIPMRFHVPIGLVLALLLEMVLIAVIFG